MKDHNSQKKNEIKELRNSMEAMEKQRRQNNVVMTRLVIDTFGNIVLKKLAFLRGKHIRIDAEMKNAHKLGPKTLLIELEDHQDEIEGKIKRYQG